MPAKSAKTTMFKRLLSPAKKTCRPATEKAAQGLEEIIGGAVTTQSRGGGQFTARCSKKKTSAAAQPYRAETRPQSIGARWRADVSPPPLRGIMATAPANVLFGSGGRTGSMTGRSRA
jgi:hypothetical protein